ncbi:hypothetical protein PVAP13_9NG383214 [Panicum virgatum]|uniref:Uncharacterized protein n=1 Tax=Panicum virgatum TaxID=38727 RepID=A0A8T0MTB7_PANVG|nr:hypothetical protein PVAP13_9NG383214 [Panicum virgatum]
MAFHRPPKPVAEHGLNSLPPPRGAAAPPASTRRGGTPPGSCAPRHARAPVAARRTSWARTTATPRGRGGLEQHTERPVPFGQRRGGGARLRRTARTPAAPCSRRAPRPWCPRGDAAAEVDLEALDAGDDQKHGDGRERTAHAGYGVEQVHLAEVVRGHDSAAHGSEWPQVTSWSRHTSR